MPKLEICFRCGIGRNLIIQNDKTFICTDCTDVMEKRKVKK